MPMNVLYCDKPNETTVAYCQKHGFVLNPGHTSWDHALIVTGHILFRRDCPLIISDKPMMLDIGLLQLGESKPDRSVLACSRKDYESVLSGEPIKDFNLLNPSFNWSRDLPWDRRLHAYVINYREEVPEQADVIFCTSPYMIYPRVEMLDFQQCGWIGRDLARSQSCDHDISRRDVYGLAAMELSPGDVILDVGANIGMFSIWAAKRWPSTRIIAFEPLQQNFENLQHNLRMNKISNVEVHQLAVAGNVRQTYVHSACDMTSLAGIYGLKQVINTGVSTIKYANAVNTTTLDQICGGLDRVRLLKIDAEGAEYEMLWGFNSFDKVERLVIEAHWNMVDLYNTPVRLRNFLDQKMPGRYHMIECR